MNNWNELSVRERAKYIRDYVALGYRKLNDIVDDYNSFGGGGIVGKLHNYTQKAKELAELNYNRPLSNGSWTTRHQQKWYDFLTSHGYKPIDAVRLSGFFAAQDAFETGGGTSDAARRKNNFGGMLRGGKNITYRDTNEYMTAKLRMMLRTFPDAMNALTIDEYATLLGDPARAAKGHSLYYVTDKIKFNANDPLWILLLTNHMHNYINGMRLYAGMKSINFNDPESLALYTGCGNILSDELSLYLVPQLILDLVALNSLLTPYALLELQLLEKLNLPKEESNETTTQSTNNYMLPLFMILNATQPIVALLLPLTSVLQSSLLPSLELLLYGNFFDGGGHLYYTGGPIKNPLFMPELDNQLLWPALNSVQLNYYPDERIGTGYYGEPGAIETFIPSLYGDNLTDEERNRIIYQEGYPSLLNPYPNLNTIIYNPLYNNNDTLAMDALHVMPTNPTYNDFYLDYINEARDKRNFDAVSNIIFNQIWGNPKYEVDDNGRLTDKGHNAAAEDAKRIAEAWLNGENSLEMDEIILPALDGALRNELAPDYLRDPSIRGSYGPHYELSPKLRQRVDAISELLQTNILPAMPYAKGGSIHINPKNKGKFSAAAKRAGMSTQLYASHVLANKDKYSSTLVKRANFARNASKWKHDFGGPLIYGGHKGLIRV